MKRFSAIATVAFVTLVCWTDSRLDQWERSLADAENSVLNGTPQVHLPKQTWEDLPGCVQRYLHRVSPEPTFVQSVSFQQEGEILMGKDGRISPFTATQVISSNPLGFSWEAQISMSPWAPSWFPGYRMSDAWVNGKGSFKKSLFAIFTTVNEENNLLVNKGQALRWLSDIALIPSTLLPEAGIVTWASIQDKPDEAILGLQVPLFEGCKQDCNHVHLEATFDSEGWMTQLRGDWPFMGIGKEDGSVIAVMKHWQVNLSNYQEQEHGFWVPRHVEWGWISSDGEYEPYMKADNLGVFHYQSNIESFVEGTSAS